MECKWHVLGPHYGLMAWMVEGGLDEIGLGLVKGNWVGAYVSQGSLLWFGKCNECNSVFLVE